MKRRHVAWQLEFEIQASIKRCIPCTVISILNKELWSKGLVFDFQRQRERPQLTSSSHSSDQQVLSLLITFSFHAY